MTVRKSRFISGLLSLADYIKASQPPLAAAEPESLQAYLWNRATDGDVEALGHYAMAYSSPEYFKCARLNAAVPLLLETAALAGHASSMALLAQALEKNPQLANDNGDAERWWKRAADGGAPEAALRCGQRLLSRARSSGGGDLLRRAIAYLATACRQGVLEAAEELYSFGRGDEALGQLVIGILTESRPHNAAAEWVLYDLRWREAGEGGLNQEGYAEAAALLKASAARGYVRALRDLGAHLLEGDLLPQNFEEALVALKGAAAAGCAESALKLMANVGIGRGQKRNNMLSQRIHKVIWPYIDPDAASLLSAILSADGGQAIASEDRGHGPFLDALAGTSGEHLTPEGRYLLAKAYLSGAVIPSRPELAALLLQSAADDRHPAATRLLGQLFDLGLMSGAPSDQGFSLMQMAAELGDVAAMEIVGLRAAGGIYGPADDNIAQENLKRGAKHGGATEVQNYARYLVLGSAANEVVSGLASRGVVKPQPLVGDEKVVADMGELYAELGSATDLIGQRNLVDVIMSRAGITGEFMLWIKQAADRGNVCAQLELGMRRCQGEWLPQDHDEALTLLSGVDTWLKDSATDEGALKWPYESCYWRPKLVALKLLDGDERSFVEATAIVAAAATRAEPWAVDLMPVVASGATNDRRLAGGGVATFWDLVHGDPEACWALAEIFADVYAVDRSQLLLNNAIANDRKTDLGARLMRFLRNDGACQDHRRLVSVMTDLAQAGHLFAMNSLADCYTEGIGVIRDREQEAAWRRKAADGGLSAACRAIGDSLRSDQPGEALQWYAKAAEQGDEQSAHKARVVSALMANAHGPQSLQQELEVLRQMSKAGVGFAAYEMARRVSSDKALPSLDRRAEAAEYYGISVRQGYRLAHQGLAELCFFSIDIVTSLGRANASRLWALVGKVLDGTALFSEEDVGLLVQASRRMAEERGGVCELWEV